MQIGDLFDVNIEGFSNLGFGIARIDGFVVFVNCACPDDFVKIKITKRNKSYAYAKIVEVLTPSAHRVKPFCALNNVCGACQMGFIDYNYQLQLKKQIVKDSLFGIDTIIHDPVKSPEILQYRHKIQYPIVQTKTSKKAGYFKPSSHQIVNIKHCPIQPAICDEIIDFIRKSDISGYIEKNHTGELRHVAIRVSSYNNKCLVTLVLNAEKPSGKAQKLAKDLYENFDEISGVCLNYNPKRTNVILGSKTQCVQGDEYICEKILDKTFKIGADTFFQVNPKSAENIFRYVKNYIKDNFKTPVVLDAYAGITAFGICISDICRQVVSIEENYNACALAKSIIDENGIKNIEINSGDASKFFAQEKRQFDVIILDPPRKGCTKESLDYAYKLSKNKIIYVSCNPSTLARDLKYLIEKGAKVDSVQPFDMFCHTYHIENVAVLSV